MGAGTSYGLETELGVASMRAEKAKPVAEIPVEVREAVKAAAPEGRLSCAKAHELAARLDVPLLVVGQAADALGVKIVSCQLGCF